LELRNNRCSFLRGLQIQFKQDGFIHFSGESAENRCLHCHFGRQALKTKYCMSQTDDKMEAT